MATDVKTDNKASTTPGKLAELTLDYGNMSIEEVYAMAREFAKGELRLNCDSQTLSLEAFDTVVLFYQLQPRKVAKQSFSATTTEICSTF